MVMGLMDKPKSDFGKSHVFIDDFILYIAFKLQEPIETVVSWLLYNGFDKNISSYEVDKHYRVNKGLQVDGIDKNIDELFNQISIDGYYYYSKYLNDHEYHHEGKETLEYDEYKVVDNSFCLNINDLKNLGYISDFNFNDAHRYNYIVYLCDSVTAKLTDMSLDIPIRTFRLINDTLDEYKDMLENRKSSSVNDNAKPVAHELINYEEIRAAIELISTGEPLPHEVEEAESKEKIYENEPLNSRSQDKKLIAILALLLASKSKIYTVGDKPNATQISKGIYEFAIQDLRIANEDMNGLKAPIAKISKAIQDYSDILYKRPE